MTSDPDFVKLPSRWAWLAACAIAVVYAGEAPAAAVQSLESIAAAARARVLALPAAGDEVAVSVARLDPRLRLAACPVALDAFLPPGTNGGSISTVGVRCGGGKPWVLYVPVTVHRLREVAVLVRSVPRGAVLGAADLRLERTDVGALTQGYYRAEELPVGMVLRRALAAGTVLMPQHLETRLAVRRGERVILTADVGGAVVRMTGEALANGAVGDTVRVRNLTSRRVVEGTVADGGVVEVRL
ncbi:MAG: flagellar basal body P-ring formation protein FlgA [Gammaproteobacteria bacterium]|nr:flagellar basal body P-ring formation protein FlgA [Gammaproteobacteria bacterium]